LPPSAYFRREAHCPTALRTSYVGALRPDAPFRPFQGVGVRGGDDEQLLLTSPLPDRRSHIDGVVKVGGTRIALPELEKPRSQPARVHDAPALEAADSRDNELWLVVATDAGRELPLTTSMIPGTPLATLHKKGFWQLPAVDRMLEELRTIVELARRATRSSAPTTPAITFRWERDCRVIERRSSPRSMPPLPARSDSAPTGCAACSSLDDTERAAGRQPATPPLPRP
jgi:hypothetical protein